jgi:hypothetical protein
MAFMTEMLSAPSSLNRAREKNAIKLQKSQVACQILTGLNRLKQKLRNRSGAMLL